MEHKNDNYTPLDCADEELLRSILQCAPGMMPMCDTPTCDKPEVCREGKGGRDARRARETRQYCKAEQGTAPGTPRREDGGFLPDTPMPEGPTSSCVCGDFNGFEPPKLQGVPLAMVYSPHQSFDGIYDCETGFRRGTIFKCLDLPFEMSCCRGRT